MYKHPVATNKFQSLSSLFNVCSLFFLVVLAHEFINKWSILSTKTVAPHFNFNFVLFVSHQCYFQAITSFDMQNSLKIIQSSLKVDEFMVGPSTLFLLCVNSLTLTRSEIRLIWN